MTPPGGAGAGWRPWSYAATLLAGGIALFVPGPWVASYLFRFDFTTSVLIFTAVVNIHHFILDGAIWKLRDGRIAALLVDSQRRAASGAAETGRAVKGAADWLVSDRQAARLLRVSALVVLCLWAVLDQARYLFATDAANLSALSRAAALNPYDTAVLARRERLLVEQGNYEDAYELYRRYLTWRPEDADALVRAGALALHLGKRDSAIDHWQRALTVSPTHPEASKYMAQVWANTAELMDKDNRVLEAARAFRAALALDETSGDRPSEGTDWFNYGQFLRRRGAEPRLVIACLLKAEALLAATSDGQLETAREVRESVERDHPEAAAAARSDPSAALAALRLPIGVDK